MVFSSIARWILGIASLFFGLVMVLSVYMEPSRHPDRGLAFAAFCFVITTACLSSRLGSGAVKIIGLVIFVWMVAYLSEAVRYPDQFSPDIVPEWVAALGSLVLFGVPGLYLAAFGEWPTADTITTHFQRWRDKRLSRLR